MQRQWSADLGIGLGGYILAVVGGPLVVSLAVHSIRKLGKGGK